VTGFGAGDSGGHGGFLYSVAFHLLLGRLYDDKDIQERIVRTSNLDWVIVRPVILTDGLKTNAYRASIRATGQACSSRVPTWRISSSSRLTTTPFCIRRQCSSVSSSSSDVRKRFDDFASEQKKYTLSQDRRIDEKNATAERHLTRFPETSVAEWLIRQ
jgi:hypothetical protein